MLFCFCYTINWLFATFLILICIRVNSLHVHTVVGTTSCFLCPQQSSFVPYMKKDSCKGMSGWIHLEITVILIGSSTTLQEGLFYMEKITWTKIRNKEGTWVFCQANVRKDWNDTWTWGWYATLNAKPKIQLLFWRCLRN